MRVIRNSNNSAIYRIAGNQIRLSGREFRTEKWLQIKECVIQKSRPNDVYAEHIWCAYYSIPIGGANAENAVWTYEKPYEAVADIKKYLAFYPTRVGAIEVTS